MELLLPAIGILLGFFIQSVAGFAAALFAIPLMLYVFDLQDSIAIIAVFLFLFSIIELYNNRKSIDKKIFSEIIVWSIIGLVIGIFLLKYGDSTLLKKILGFLMLFYAFYSLIEQRKMYSLDKYGFAFGLVGGIFSGLYASGGSVYATYLNNKLKKSINIRATLIGILAVTNFLRIPLLTYNEILTLDILIKSLYLLPFFLVALFLGHIAFAKMNDKIFRNIVLVLLLLSGLSLILK